MAVFLTACGSKLPTIKSYEMDIQQGNVVTSKMLMQLRPGMTKSQVRYILGTPLLVDSFHNNRWDYFYELRQQGKVIEKRRVILDFENDLLKSVRGDVVAANDKSPEAPVDTSARSVSPPKVAEETSWLDKLMFWKSKPEAVATAAVAAAAVDAVAKAPEAAVAAAEPAAKAEVDAPQSVLRQNQDSLLTSEMPAVPVVPVLPEAQTATTEVPAQATLAPAEPTPSAAPLPPAESAAVADNASASNANAAEEIKPTEAQPTVQEATIREALSQWADAWRSKNINAYLSAYADNFKPEGGISKKAWAAQRKQRLSPKQGAIGLMIEDVVVETKGNRASVQFWQQYSSKVYRDEVLKQLDFELDTNTNRWRIVREFVTGSSKKATEQKVLAPEATSEHLEGVIEQIGF